MNIFPNPANGPCVIRYETFREDHVKVILSDSFGRQLDILVNEQLSPGKHASTVNTAGLSPGVYFIQLISSQMPVLERMVVGTI
jgi:hypothetical protein